MFIGVVTLSLLIFIIFFAHGGNKIPIKIINITLLIKQKLLIIILIRPILILQLESFDLHSFEAHFLQLAGIIYINRNMRGLQLGVVEAAFVEDWSAPVDRLRSLLRIDLRF